MVIGLKKRIVFSMKPLQLYRCQLLEQTLWKLVTKRVNWDTVPTIQTNMWRYKSKSEYRTFIYLLFLVMVSLNVEFSDGALNLKNHWVNSIGNRRLAKTWKLDKNIFNALTRQSTRNSKSDTDALPYDPEASMNAVQIITNRGYPVASYSVATDDGYILELHRIPHGKGQSTYTMPYGKPVLLQHGIVGSSVDWLAAPTKRSLAFRLADLGFDVWLGNARGNTYSRRHKTLNPRYQYDYWKFSWDEMGKYDIPAVLNFILSETGRDQLIYIGHSMGCAMFFVTMSTFPELGSKIEFMIGLAPAASMANLGSPIPKALAPFAKPIEFFFELFRVRDFLDNDSRSSYWTKRFCNQDLSGARFCANKLFLLLGDDPSDLKPNLLSLLANHSPAGTSTRTVVQFAMNYNAGQTFIPYDFGLLGNLRRYGQRKPPPYDLSKVTPPVYLFHGRTDLLVTPADVAWLASKLINVKGTFLVNSEYYNHLDFLFHENNNELLYNPLIALLPSPA